MSDDIIDRLNAQIKEIRAAWAFETTALRAELAAEREKFDHIENYVSARVKEHMALAEIAEGALSGKKQRVRASETSEILGKIREMRK